MSVRKVFIGLGKAVFYWGFLQVILIGGAYFAAIPPEFHALSGTLLALAVLIMFILAIVGKMGGAIIGLSLLTLLMLEPGAGFLTHYEGLAPIVRALHPILGIGVMFLGQSLAKRAEKLG